MDTNDTNDDLKRLAPTLASLPKSDPFITPDAFFDGFPHQVQAAIVARQRSPRALWVRRFSLALPVVAILGLGTWWLGHGSTGGNDPAIKGMNAPVVTPLAENELDYLDAADAEELAAEGAVTDLGTVDIDLQDEEVLAYLEHEHTDIAELITEE